MSKRFTETEIWREDWFIDLPKDYQILWIYIKDNCDHAGVFKPNVSMFNKVFNTETSLEKALALFNKDKERIKVLRNGRWFILQFIEFQYGCVLNLNNRVHNSIFNLLKGFGVNLTSTLPQIRVNDTLKDKDKDKDIKIVGGKGEGRLGHFEGCVCKRCKK